MIVKLAAAIGCVSLFFMLPASCRAVGLELGRPAPPLTLSEVLQAPAGTSATWADLKGDAVILEFWATWCPGCRDQIPHLNRLSAEFKDKPIRFISITDEEPAVVGRFLKDFTMAGWIGIDSSGATFNEYGVIGRPQIVLVDSRGIVRGIGPPTNLTAELIENLLEGRRIEFSSEATVKLQAFPDPLFQAMVRPAAPDAATGFSPGAESGKAGISQEWWGVPLIRLLSAAYGVPEERIEAPAWAGEARYDAAVAAPDLTGEKQRELLLGALQSTFQLKAHEEARPTNVYVLIQRPGVEPVLRHGSSHQLTAWDKEGSMKATSASMAWLGLKSSQVLGKPVVDETELAGNFDFELHWNPADPNSLPEAIRKQLNLDLVPSNRPLEYLVVDTAVEPRTW